MNSSAWVVHDVRLRPWLKSVWQFLFIIWCIYYICILLIRFSSFPISAIPSFSLPSRASSFLHSQLLVALLSKVSLLSRFNHEWRREGLWPVVDSVLIPSTLCSNDDPVMTPPLTRHPFCAPLQRNPAIAHFKGPVDFMPYCKRCLIANI